MSAAEIWRAALLYSLASVGAAVAGIGVGWVLSEGFDRWRARARRN